MAQGGVGILVDTNAAKLLFKVEEDILQYYESLRRSIESVPAHNFLIILGDFNAQLGLDDARYTMHTTSHRNGKLLHELGSREISNHWKYIILKGC